MLWPVQPRFGRISLCYIPVAPRNRREWCSPTQKDSFAFVPLSVKGGPGVERQVDEHLRAVPRDAVAGDLVLSAVRLGGRGHIDPVRPRAGNGVPGDDRPVDARA